MTFTCPTCLLEYKTKQGFVLHFPYIGYIFRLKKTKPKIKKRKRKVPKLPKINPKWSKKSEQLVPKKSEVSRGRKQKAGDPPLPPEGPSLKKFKPKSSNIASKH